MLEPKKGPNGKFGYVDSETGHWRISPMYEEATDFLKHSVAGAKLAEKRWILISEDNKNITGKIYSEIKVGQEYIVASEINLKSVVDMKDNEIASSEEMWIIDITDHGTALVTKQDKYGVINLETKKRIDCMYDKIFDFNPGEEFAVACKNEKYGLINWDNEVIIPFEFDDMKIHQKSKLIIAHKDGKYGIFNSEGNVIYPFKYDDISIKEGSIQFTEVITTLVSIGDIKI